MASTLPEKTDIEEAGRWLERYPYFTLPAILALRSGVTPGPRADALAARVAISMPDMDSMARTLGQQAPLFDNFYPDEQRETPDTIGTIDTFLSTFGKTDERETEALSKLIFNPIPDYAAVLAAEERESAPTAQDLDNPELSEQDRLINSFIAGNHTSAHRTPHTDTPPATTVTAKTQTLQSDKSTNAEIPARPTPDTAPKESENPSLTESLVRVLIKNRNYTKAIEIISDLSLKNPEKSIYFADQIRFLRKLIINENKK